MGKLTANEKSGMALALTIIGACFLPWIEYTDILGKITIIGFYSELSVVVLPSVALLFVLLISGSYRVKQVAILIAGFFSLYMTGAIYVQFSGISSDFVFASADLGIGLYIALLASFGLILSGLTAGKPSDVESKDKVLIPTTPSVAYCPSCGMPNATVSSFCGNCGVVLTPV